MLLSQKNPKAIVRILGEIQRLSNFNLYSDIRNYKIFRFIFNFILGIIEKVGRKKRPQWQYYEQGGVQAQIDLLMAYPNNNMLIDSINERSKDWRALLNDIDSYYPTRKSPVKDELLVLLAESVSQSEDMPVKSRREALDQIFPEIYHEFSKEKFALRALEYAIEEEETLSSGPITFNKEGI